ncbi:glycoprotein 3-alpha-L-fucosyltransferase A-like [Crassostrea angulata]|uniref:glycoprotein 3-alpha-L-fucosyltransferase A-like n=1 Tax=Magallana angulata TaxID=2784310 RepID=UPI0022B15050|nr:glycoprotein 3-alpha-L-fucosyltransferase A-like [Crassostrea angulata]XP_052705261.1 glycoprotein 3-alpha-L-fucosyltransferase A-like [Crassostrea angulata]
MKPTNLALLVFGITGMLLVFILGYFSSSEKIYFTDVHPHIKNSDTQTTSFNGESNSINNKTLVILWYNLPFYLKSSVTYFQANKCSNFRSTCILSTVNSDIIRSSGVIFTHSTLPRTPPMRNTSQVWIFNTLENKAFTHWPNSAWDYKFEWTMSYRRNADVSRPYGKIIRLDKSIHRNYSEVFRQKTKFGVWMSGHCPVPSRRKEYIEKLQKYIDIDTFGSCGKKKCGTRTPAMNDCLKNFSRDYKFYFSFENNICRDYSTEKVFNFYQYNLSIIPVVNGPPQAREYLPKGTFINTFDFTSPEKLAKKLKEIGSSEKLYTQYLREKDKYGSLNNSEIFRESMCSACKKLDQLKGRNIITKPKVIDVFKNEC